MSTDGVPMPAVRQPLLASARPALALAIVGAIAALSSMAAPPPTRAAQHAIQIADSAFSPATLTVTAGDTVTWTNGDGRPHTVTSNDGAFDSGNLDVGQAFSFTFGEPGTYTYRCSYHDEMQATIVVQAVSAPAPSQAAPGGTDANATTTGGTAAASHTAGTHGAGQPDTALEVPVSISLLSPLLIGLGLVALAFGVIPPARESTRAGESRPAGWRR
jgi:plastocyanin